MQSELLAEPQRSEEPSRSRCQPPPEYDKGGSGVRMAGIQQFFVEWEVAEP